MRPTRTLFLVLALVAPAACTTTVIAPMPAASVGAQLSVERFLQAANERDVTSMGRLFGTADGPAMETGGTLGCAFKKIGSWFGGNSCLSRQEVELRMDAIAMMLLHQDYRIISERQVAGRESLTSRVMVHMTTERGVDVPGVGFDVVRADSGQWLVEFIDLRQIEVAR